MVWMSSNIVRESSNIVIEMSQQIEKSAHLYYFISREKKAKKKKRKEFVKSCFARATTIENCNRLPSQFLRCFEGMMQRVDFISHQSNHLCFFTILLAASLLPIESRFWNWNLSAVSLLQYSPAFDFAYISDSLLATKSKFMLEIFNSSYLQLVITILYCT